MSAQAVVITPTETTEDQRLRKIIWDWLSTDAGAVVDTRTVGEDPRTVDDYNGVLLRVEWIPDSGGTAPTTLYDTYLYNEDGVDVLNGMGVDRSATATESKNFSDGLGCVVNSKLRLVVANAGDAKGGKLIAYVG